MKPKIDDEDLFEFVRQSGVVTAVVVAKKYNVRVATACNHLIDLVRLNKIRYVRLPKLPRRLYKKPFDGFRKKRLYFVDADELYRWLQRQVDGVCDRDKKIFFSIIDNWFMEVVSMPYIRIRDENGVEKTVSYAEFEEEIKPRWKAEMYDTWRKRQEKKDD